MITSPRNPKIAAALRLKRRSYRDEDGRFLVEGERTTREALRSGALLSLFHTPSEAGSGLVAASRDSGANVEAVAEEVMAKLTSTVTPPGIVGVASRVDVALSDIADLIGCVAVLCEVRDPGNAGTIVRSADASGMSAVVFAGSSVDPYNPKTVRASAGSVFHVPVVRGSSVEDSVLALRSRGARIIATSSEGEASIQELDLSGPVALLFGNEAHGLSSDVAGIADVTARVPMHGGAESLNLASAATLCMFEAARQGGAGQVSTAQLVAGAAHDLRSPLAIVSTLAGALGAAGPGLSQDEREEMLTAISHEARRGDLLVQQLLDAARYRSGTLPLHAEPVEVAGVARDLAAFVAEDADLPPVEVRGDGTALADPTRLRNGLYAMVETLAWFASVGPIALEVSVKGPTVRVRASRAGCHVSGAEADALFEPRAPGSGSGSKLGLYVAGATAAAAGGRMWVESGDELVLWLELPAYGAVDSL
jgi:TrmH family RNA methyltransferase